eukprot:PLAT15919.1.p1 GENE.PLAT15919.1~~PLAT15919.1.p1  ORF type:complete len:1334 (+),score=543.12 PLAT15919.1:95-4003(+)
MDDGLRSPTGSTAGSAGSAARLSLPGSVGDDEEALLLDGDYSDDESDGEWEEDAVDTGDVEVAPLPTLDGECHRLRISIEEQAPESPSSRVATAGDELQWREEEEERAELLEGLRAEAEAGLAEERGRKRRLLAAASSQRGKKGDRRRRKRSKGAARSEMTLGSAVHSDTGAGERRGSRSRVAGIVPLGEHGEEELTDAATLAAKRSRRTYSSAAATAGSEDVGIEMPRHSGKKRRASKSAGRIRLPDAAEKPSGGRRGSRHKRTRRQWRHMRRKSSLLAVAARRITLMTSEDKEGLGEDYLDSPFLPPSSQLAAEKRTENTFRGGSAPVCATETDALGDMGVGIELYFRFLLFMAAAFAIISVLSLPSLLLSLSGNRVAEEDRDVFGLSAFTLGNQGEGLSSVSIQDCETGRTDCNRTTVALLNTRVTATTAAYILSAADVMAMVAFAFVIYMLRRSAALEKEYVDTSHVTLSDYAVYVTGLPSDVTEGDVLDHFKAVAAARRPDFKPVEDADYNNKFRYLDGAVADVVLARSNGRIIRRFLDINYIGYELRIARAAVKQALSVGLLLASPRVQKLKSRVSVLQGKLQAMCERINSTATAGDDACLGAFVVFNEDRTANEVLRAYRGSDTVWRFFQADDLRLAGQTLTVSRAPDPSTILWENMEVTKRERLGRQLLTAIVTILLLAISFTLVFTAQTAKRNFKDAVPSQRQCDVEVPAIALGTYDFGSASARLSKVAATSCSGTNVHIAVNGSTSAMAYASSNTSCLSCYAPRCQSECVPSACLQPCVDPADDQLCPTLSCYDTGGSAAAAGAECATLRRNSIVSCFCRAELERVVDESGLTAAADFLLQEESVLCGEFATNLLLGQTLTLVAAMGVVVINFGLEAVLDVLVRYERHSSVTTRSSAVMWRILVGNFVNTAVILLLVNARLPAGVTNPFEGYYILNGQYDDFYVRWYSTVGVSLMLTMIFNIVAPHIAPLLRAFIVHPLRIAIFRSAAFTQRQLDDLYQGPQFNLASRYATVLNTVFVSLMYSGGLPLLPMLALLAMVVMYWVDKWLMLRVYNKPPRFDESLNEAAIDALPWAVLIHLVITCWMFSTPGMLQSSTLAVGQIVDTVAQDSLTVDDAETISSSLGLAGRLLQLNVFPLFLLTIALLCYLLFGRLMLSLLQRLWHQLHPSLVESLLVHAPTFTGTYRRVFRLGSEPLLDDVAKARGWALHKRPRYWVQVKKWMKDESVDGVPRVAGERKRTWEVIRDSMLHSYLIDHNPLYRDALQLRDASLMKLLRGQAAAFSPRHWEQASSRW